jgi:SAM-dependent methyltransferase
MTYDIDALKARLKATWMAGDYAHFATFMLPGAMEFLPFLAVKNGERVLDVGCGAGQLALPVARAGGVVTGVDIATNTIDAARRRAAEAMLDVRFEEGDAEALAFADGSFDVVFSFIGAMFAPRPERVAAEFVRTCRPGGRIVMGNWTPAGFVGQMFRAVAKHVPPPPGMPSPVLWGDEAVVRERFAAAGATSVEVERRMFPFAYPFGPSGVVDLFRKCYGPTTRGFASLDAAGQAALESDLTRVWTDANRATDGTTRVDAEYLAVRVARP